ncbi:VWA domain-containing protein [Candidatus Woesearchaeota archaeon]|nr:VWA domain-containing protein [Candidatus Woesearchaeota archaeon]
MASELDTYLRKVYENLRTRYNDTIAKDTVDALREVLSEDLLKALQQLQSGEKQPPSVPIDTVPGGGSGSGKGSDSDQGGQGAGSGAGSGDRSEKREGREGYDKKVKPGSDYSKQKPASRNKKRRLSPRDEELSKALLKKFFKKALSKGYKQKIVREMPEEEIFRAKTAGGGEESLTVTHAPRGSSEELRQLNREVASLESGLRASLEKLKTKLEEQEIQPSRKGGTFDTDGLVNAVVDIYSGERPTNEIYRGEEEPVRRNVFYFLIDVSSSTAGEIIYEEKKALLALAKTLKALKDKFSIYAFGGEYIYKVKDELNHNFDSRVGLKIAGLTADGGTPLGMMVRYLNKKVLPKVGLKDENDEDTYLVIITDGLLDNYEDTKAAIKEVKKKGIKVIYIFVNKEPNEKIDELGEQADFYVKIIGSVKELPSKLAKLYEKIKFGK